MGIIFDGTDDCIGKDNISIFNSSGFSTSNYAFTTSCWIKPHGRQNGGIWEQYDGSVGAGRLGMYLISSGKIRLRFKNSYVTSSSVVIADNSITWYHIVSQHQYASREIFVDNSSVKSHISNQTSDHSTSGLDFKIGKAFSGSPGSAYYFDGEIAEWAAWDVALTAGEITSLYNGASPLFVRPGKIRAYFPMGGPYVGSTATAAGAYRDVMNTYDLDETSSPTFAPNQFQSSAAGLTNFFYPNTYMGTDTIPFTSSGGGEEEAADEAAITGDDVLHEIITANRRTQAGIIVNSGGINFKKRDNTDSVDAQVQVDELNDRFVKSSRVTHDDANG